MGIKPPFPILGRKPEVFLLTHLEGPAVGVHIGPRDEHDLLFPTPGAKQELNQVCFVLIGDTQKALDFFEAVLRNYLFNPPDSVSFQERPLHLKVIQKEM
jgi:hypothetical protein